MQLSIINSSISYFLQKKKYIVLFFHCGAIATYVLWFSWRKFRKSVSGRNVISQALSPFSRPLQRYFTERKFVAGFSDHDSPIRPFSDLRLLEEDILQWDNILLETVQSCADIGTREKSIMEQSLIESLNTSKETVSISHQDRTEYLNDSMEEKMACDSVTDFTKSFDGESFLTAKDSSFEHPIGTPISMTSIPSRTLFFSPCDCLSPLNSSYSHHLSIYEEGLNEVRVDKVHCRSVRTDLLHCVSKQDYLAKLYALRMSFAMLLENIENRLYLVNQGAVFLTRFMTSLGKDPSNLKQYYMELVHYCEEENWCAIEQELSLSGVYILNFYDIIVDFILLEAIEDLSKVPVAVMHIFENDFFSNDFKQTVLTKVISNSIQEKQSKLSQCGFLWRFYNISSEISPVIACGLLGEEVAMKNCCQHLKKSILSYSRGLFDINCVRFTNIEELNEDVWKLTKEFFTQFNNHPDEDNILQKQCNHANNN